MIFMPSSSMPPTPSLPKCGTCRWHTLQIELKSIARNVSRLIRLDLWMSFGSLDNEHLLMDVNGMWRLPWSTPLQTSDPTGSCRPEGNRH